MNNTWLAASLYVSLIFLAGCSPNDNQSEEQGVEETKEAFVPSDHRPVISPDGNTIVFMSTRENEDWELFLINRDGSGLKKLTDHKGWDGYAAFAPDGQAFIFDRETDTSRGAYKYNLETGEIASVIVLDDGRAAVSDWSANDSGKIVLFVERDENRDLYFADANGQNLEQVTDTPERNEHEGCFSPDGTQLAYATQTKSGSGLEVMDLSNGEVSRLVESTQYLYGLSWNPDGTRIAYTDTPNDNPDGNAELYTVEIASGVVTQLTHNEDYDHMPVWFSGTEIMYSSYASGREEIYIFDLSNGKTSNFDTGL